MLWPIMLRLVVWVFVGSFYMGFVLASGFVVVAVLVCFFLSHYLILGLAWLMGFLLISCFFLVSLPLASARCKRLYALCVAGSLTVVLGEVRGNAFV